MIFVTSHVDGSTCESHLAIDEIIVAEYLKFMEQMDEADIHVCS